MAADMKLTKGMESLPMEEFEPAPTIFVDGMQGVTVTNGVAKINCFTIYADAEGQTRRRLVARLALPVGVLPGVQQFCSLVLQQLKDSGLVVEVPNVKQ